MVDTATKIKYVYTFALYYCFIACGLCFSIFNPTLLDLKEIFDTSLTRVSLVFPIRATGYVFGTLSFGIITTLLNRQLVLSVILIIKAATIALVPHWQNVYQFYGNAVFNGFFTAGIDTTVNVWCNEIWGSSGGPYMQALHFFFGIGAILGPILAQPFLSPTNQNHTEFSLLSHTNLNYFGNITDVDEAVHYKSKLYIPYSIAAMTACVSSAVFFILYCVHPYQEKFDRNQQQTTNQGSNQETTVDERDGDVVVEDTQQLVVNEDNDEHDVSRRSRFQCPNRSTLWLTSIGALFLFVYAGSETSYFQFSAAFVTQTGLHLPKSTAAYMASTLALSFTLTRALSILIAIKLRPQHMLYIDCAVLIAANITMLLFADTNETLVWIANCMLGVGYASMFPSFYPFLESTVRISTLTGSVFLFSAGVSSTVCPLIVGLFIEAHPLVLVELCLVSMVLTITVLIVLDVTIHLREKRARLLLLVINDDNNSGDQHQNQM